MVKILGNGGEGTVQYYWMNQPVVSVRPSFSPEGNVSILVNSIRQELNKVDLMTPLGTRLENFGDEFLKTDSMKKLNFQEKSLVVTIAQEIFHTNIANSLKRSKQDAVDSFFQSLTGVTRNNE